MQVKRLRNEGAPRALAEGSTEADDLERKMAVCRAGVRIGEMCGVLIASGIGRGEKDLHVLIIEGGMPDAGAEASFVGCWVETAQMPSGAEEPMWGQRYLIRRMEKEASKEDSAPMSSREWRCQVDVKIKRRENMVYRIISDMKFEVK